MTPETPRTDALWAHLSQHGWGREHLPCSTIMESHEKLERELANCRKWSSELADVFDDLRAELAAEWALSDRLAAWMKDHRRNWQWHEVDPSCDCEDCVFLVPFDEAIAAWKEARK